MLLYACTIFTSAFLLFLVQPIIAKQILPWFGGSAAVWTTCLVFFQVALLAGYAYADATTRRLTPRTQALLHVGLLALSLALLPIIPDASWQPSDNADPGLRILGLLLVTLGLPYFLLATTGPLLQAWAARRLPQASVYRLFALSNFASLLALLCYPFALEPWITTRVQAQAWSVDYVLFVLLTAAAAWVSLKGGRIHVTAAATVGENDPPPTRFTLVIWLALSALGSWLLLAITNHLTQNIAAIPLLWLLPLALYLLTFMLAFAGDAWYRRGLFLPLLALLLVACSWGLQSRELTLNLKLAIPLYLAGLFVCCMFLHGELARLRPAPRYLTRFYLMVALGGALGGIFVGIIAPRVFPAYYELGLTFVLISILGSIVLRKLPFFMVLISIGLAGVCGQYWTMQMEQLQQDTRVMTRNFYGTLRTKDVGSGETRVRRLMHGVILHGEQYLDPAYQRAATTYYGPDSGIGLALASAPAKARRIGVIGLGTGTLATYGRPGDVYRFYDINPQVVEIANSEFTYLRDSAATVEISIGDARLNLEREEPQQFDVLVVDAFSSDAIPVHLMTQQAVALYLQHLKPDGVIAIHVTNRFIKLAPVVKRLADSAGVYAALIRDEAKDTNLSSTDWVLMARNPARLAAGPLAGKGSPFETIPGLAPWTDDFNNLFRILK